MSNPSQSLIVEYSAKAAAYDRLWSPVIHPMARHLLRALPLASARQVIDVGTGTGAMLPDLVAVAPEAYVVGVDGSEGMLRIAQRSARPGLAVMNICPLAFRSEAIDVAVLAFVLFHAPDPAAVLREVHRVLRDGGTLGVVTWGKDPGAPGVSIWSEELDAHGAAPDPRAPSVMQHARMDTPAKLTSLLKTAGFASVRAWSTSFEHRWTLGNLVALHVECGMAGRRLPSLREPKKTTCRLRAETRLARLGSEQMAYRPEVVFAVAYRR